jgi:hypothetical protein
VAYSHPVPEPYKRQGWKIKIQDKERLEDPHVTIIFRKRRWRVNLRSGGFMDRRPDAAEVPSGLMDEIVARRDTLSSEWNRINPHNPV